MKKHFMYRLYEMRNMRSVFILRMKTIEAQSFNRFKIMIPELCTSAELLHTKKRVAKNYYEIIFLVKTEKMLEVKKLIDTEIKYDVLQLFEYVTWQ